MGYIEPPEVPAQTTLEEQIAKADAEKQNVAFKIIDPATVVGLSKEAKLQEYFNVLAIQEEAEATCRMIKEMLMEEMEQDQEPCGEYFLSRVSRTTISTKVEDAMNFGAAVQVTKYEVDKEKIKKLIAKGIEVPGVNKTTYLKIDKIEKGESHA